MSEVIVSETPEYWVVENTSAAGKTRETRPKPGSQMALRIAEELAAEAARIELQALSSSGNPATGNLIRVIATMHKRAL